MTAPKGNNLRANLRAPRLQPAKAGRVLLGVAIGILQGQFAFANATHARNGGDGNGLVGLQLVVQLIEFISATDEGSGDVARQVAGGAGGRRGWSREIDLIAFNVSAATFNVDIAIVAARDCIAISLGIDDGAIGGLADAGVNSLILIQGLHLADLVPLHGARHVVLAALVANAADGVLEVLLRGIGLSHRMRVTYATSLCPLLVVKPIAGLDPRFLYRSLLLSKKLERETGDLIPIL